MTEQAGDYSYAAGLRLGVAIQDGTVPRCDVYVDAQLDDGLTGWLHVHSFLE